VLADPALRADWGERGRAIAEQRYAWPIVARRVEEIYREVLDGAAPRDPAIGRVPERSL